MPATVKLLERDRATALLVPRPIHRAVAALAEQLLDANVSITARGLELVLGNSALARVGQPVTAVGNARGQGTLTSSIGTDVDVDRHWSVPRAFAARATASSPSWKNDFSAPVGHRKIGLL